MIFFSDLDNTLIFGKRWTLNSDIDSIVGVERKDELEIAYMTNKGYELLKELSQNLNFIPTTARTIEQYKRIHIFKKSIKVKYAIMTNGGNILIDGDIDKDWQKRMNIKIKNSLGQEEGKEIATKIIGIESIKNLKTADNIYFYAVLKKALSEEIINELKEYFNPKGVSVKNVGKKVYFIPFGVDKHKACVYLKDLIGENDYFSAGDSIMDENMLLNSELGFIPASGGLSIQEEICNLKNIKISHESGPKTSEYILEYLLEKAKSKKFNKIL
ncbi:hypothetical protein J2Z35_000153 [Acetoanaerobium pronyense]|uniref:Sucrose phosphatase-like domain-containing protein n=1 Tax=Acetoanaerobium pronyense TaxID=1482736 RepID=A0ABS4KF27_9FIRM|nr:HAD family hydrolase [Acetoanaerobium pronyense]MBP2026364.1 hypothetical protein [Acetoanaerobium pronyense]